MKNISRKIQLALRVIIALVALGLIVAGIVNLTNYFRDNRTEKKSVIAQIVPSPHDSDDVIFQYTFEGKTYEREPVDKFLHDYGKIGTEKRIYVNTKNPKRIFLKNPPHGEIYRATMLWGWGILLGLIVYSERRILKLLNINSKQKNKE